MKHVALVLAHQGPTQVAELAEALSPSAVFLHLDAKADAAEFGHIAVHQTSQRVAVHWGGWSMIEATLALLREAASIIEADDRVTLLSGDSYPLAPIEQMLRELDPAAQYVNLVRMPSPSLGKPLTRLSRVHLEGGGFARKVVNRAGIPRAWRRRLGGRAPFAGSQWWSVTGEMALEMLATVERDTGLQRLARRSLVPDEFLLQTIIANSALATRVEPSIVWADFANRKNGRPPSLDLGAVDRLADAERLVTHHGYGTAAVAYFARKFDDPAATARVRSVLWS